MNINDVNNPLLGGEQVRGTQFTGKKETDRTEKTTGREKIQQQETETRASRETATPPMRDVYESTENRRLAAELSKVIENEEPEPREEAVNGARERVQSGYYNSREFLDRLAAKLVNNGVTRL